LSNDQPAPSSCNEPATLPAQENVE
jgi:hypothetical protein